ncbi:MAG TPA: asparaginase [Thermomicrobiales bacterium]|nr:asparaginase [Thermomicrobiales bacterium]
MAGVIAEATRGGIVESVHHGVVVAVDVDGDVVASAGDPETVVFFRSSAKPFQAIPVIESGAADAFGFTPAELALCCASHEGSPEHQQQVATMLAKIGMSATDLQCGCVFPGHEEEAAQVILGGIEGSPLHCDCSGKHAGMLATIVQEGLSHHDYLDPMHPLQLRILGIMAEVMRVPEETIVLGTDGCSLPTFGAPVRAFATAYAALAAPERTLPGAGREHSVALDRLRAAMTAFPENVAGPGQFVTDLMALSGGRVAAKSGAEGLICLAVPEQNLGIAIRVLDGTFRTHAPVTVAVLEQLGILDADTRDAILERHSPELRNHNGRLVGEIRPAFHLERAAVVA